MVKRPSRPRQSMFTRRHCTLDDSELPPTHDMDTRPHGLVEFLSQRGKTIGTTVDNFDLRVDKPRERDTAVILRWKRRNSQGTFIDGTTKGRLVWDGTSIPRRPPPGNNQSKDFNRSSL